MKNVTPNRVLPNWAIEELGSIASETGLRFTVHQIGEDLAQLEIRVIANIYHYKGINIGTFIVSMRDDWEDLRHLSEGDLYGVVAERFGKYMSGEFCNG